MNVSHHRLPYRVFAFLLALVVACGTLSYVAIRYDSPSASTEAPLRSERVRVVVLDAGHGGEDGGAVSKSGIAEKDLNLAVTLLLRDLLVANGISVILTRETDTLLYDKTADYEGRKKALDLEARRKIAEQTPNCVFVSIHMNTYPIDNCTGLQVWYSPNNPLSQELAVNIQSTTKAILQPNNDRRIKASGSSIYLLYHLTVPAVLVECGFLSTPHEAELLATPEYQKKLAFTIFCGIMGYGSEKA